MSPVAGIVRNALRSRLVRTVTALVVLAAGATAWWLATPGGVPYPTGTFGMATGSAGGVYALYGQLLKPAVQQEIPGVKLRLDPTAGGPQNLQRIVAGQDDFGIATADAIAHFTAPGATQLRALGRLYDDYVQLVVPSDSPIETVADLRGKRVGVGQADSGVALIAGGVLQVAGLDPARGDLTPLPLGIDDSATQLREGHIDAFFWSGGLPSSAVTTLSKQMKVRLIPLGQLSAAMDTLAGQEDPDAREVQIYRSSTVPTSAYPEMSPYSAVQTLAVANMMVTRADVPAGLVQRMTGVLIDSRDSIGEQVHPAQMVDIRSAIYTDPLPLAEGARRYYVSVKP
ncbi:TAXI family TRAP transporter solute-binding subunit [Streptacidiphilus sp. 4-A2]|nr:TAXI family TRAP transporter solute-binding subunit [Streptacidiphilus sp. 4-A2]